MDPSVSRELIQRGQQRYEREVRKAVEHLQGKMVALDVNSGQFAVGDDSQSAIAALREISPTAAVYLVRVGHPAAVQLGTGRATRG